MTIQTCSAALILGLWYSSLGAAAATEPLGILVRAYRESPSPARRSAIVSYIAGHPKEASLGNLALGITAYEQNDWAAAIAALKPLQGKLAPIDDYAAYYLALSRVESNDFGVTADDLAPAHRNSPLNGRSWLVEARARKASGAVSATAAAADAVRLLREHYAELPQPEGDVTLADCYQAANLRAQAAELYQKVYYHYLSGAAAFRSAAALVTLKDTMGSDYPLPGASQRLDRADRLMEAKEYAQALSEYQAVAAQAGGVERDQALVRVGAADFLAGKTALAWPYLRDLAVAESPAAAERLYYLAECARLRNDDTEMMSAVGQLAARYQQSPWRLKALISAANRYLLLNRPQDYVPLYQAVYQDFPASALAATSHWKVTFQAYLHDRADASRLLREHLRQYPAHSTAGAALYFLGRYLERSGEVAGARVCYRKLAAALENHYYAMLARARLKVAGPSAAVSAAASGEIAQFVSGIRFSAPAPMATAAAAATEARIERSRLLRSAGLNDLADAELRFGMRTDGQPALLAMELAASAAAPHQAMRIMKNTSPEYLNVPVPAAPRKFWELLFPLPYKADVLRTARERDLDPYLLAGLIRQESEFDPLAVSRAKAYGLTQIRPATGRQYARKAGVSKVTESVLYQPVANLKLGSSILRSMLDQQGGKVEQMLAAYNAGPNKVVEWMAWSTYREPAEFVESIPFTETRDYVQAVLRNAEMYRRLYP